MTPLDALSPDQRAVLQLLLKQGKRYEELAALLRIDAGSVRQRAIAALDALGPETELVAGRRAQLTDWLLGQQDPAEIDRTLDLLEASAGARAWTAAVASELRAGGLGGERLPDVPAAAGPAEQAAPAAATAPDAAAPRSPAPEPDDEPPRVADDDAEHLSRMPGFSEPPADDGRPPASRLGGALLLAGIVIVIAAALVWALTQGDDGETQTNPTVAQTTPTQTTPSDQEALVPVAQINLYGTGGSDAVGVARLYEQGSQRVVGIDAQGLERNTSADQYALWLTEGPNGSARRLGFIEKVRRNGRLSVATALPANAGRFKRMVISRETTATGRTPAEPVLSGRLRLG